MITWRDVSAPSFGESNRLLKSGQETLTRAVSNLGSMAGNAASNITDKNTQRMVDSLSNVGDGLDGVEALEGLKQSSLSAEALASTFGSAIDRDRLDSSVGDLRNKLEGQAFGEFNERLALANQTGDFSQLNDFTSRADSLLDDASGMRNAAVDSEKRYIATDLYQQWQSGALSAGEFRKAALGMPSNEYVLEGLAQANAKMERDAEIGRQRRQQAITGNLFIRGNSIREKMLSGGLDSNTAMSELTQGMSNEDIGANIPYLSGLQEDFKRVELAQSELTPQQKMVAEGWNEVIDQTFADAVTNVNQGYELAVSRLGVIGQNINTTPEDVGRSLLSADESKRDAIERVPNAMQIYHPAVIQTYLQSGKSKKGPLGGNRAIIDELDSLQMQFNAAQTEYDLIQQRRQEALTDIGMAKLSFNQHNVIPQVRELGVYGEGVGRELVNEARSVVSSYNPTEVSRRFDITPAVNPEIEQLEQRATEAEAALNSALEVNRRMSVRDTRSLEGSGSSILRAEVVERSNSSNREERLLARADAVNNFVADVGERISSNRSNREARENSIRGTMEDALSNANLKPDDLRRDVRTALEQLIRDDSVFAEQLDEAMASNPELANHLTNVGSGHLGRQAALLQLRAGVLRSSGEEN